MIFINIFFEKVLGKVLKLLSVDIILCEIHENIYVYKNKVIKKWDLPTLVIQNDRIVSFLNHGWFSLDIFFSIKTV